MAPEISPNGLLVYVLSIVRHEEVVDLAHLDSVHHNVVSAQQQAARMSDELLDWSSVVDLYGHSAYLCQVESGHYSFLIREMMVQ